MKMIINIDVPELAPAIEFYCKAFELKLSRILDPDVAELIGSEAILYLLKKEIGSACSMGSLQHRSYARHWTPVHIDLVVTDIDQSLKRVLSAGSIQEGECVNWRGSKSITFSDPFGHGFCLIEFEESSYS